MDWQTYLAENQNRFLDELFEFIRIPSVSALPQHEKDVLKAAQWVADRLMAAGVENVKVMPTGGHPVVYGDWLHAADAPTILIYGHFDVQPADPFGLWESPPFEPELRHGRVYARGASDDKGGMLIPILAVEALIKTTGELPVNVKFCFEGQEEIGSPQLPKFIADYRDTFACDLVLSADGLMWSPQEPALVTALKGLCSVQINVYGAQSDLHSGLHGGVLQNPAEALGRIIASMRTADGVIDVPGFYDDVVPLTETDRAQIAAVPFDAAAYQAELGIAAFFGEAGYTVRERNWARPTLEVNGIWGGFQGEGTKTVIPSAAHAKITCRLVAHQEPTRIVQCLIEHVERLTPPGVRAEVVRLPGSALPYLMAADHWGNAIAADVLNGLFGKDPYYVRLGGSIPICPLFLQELNAYTVNFGFSLADEMLHAPNEFFRVESFERGQTGYCQILYKLGEHNAS